MHNIDHDEMFVVPAPNSTKFLEIFSRLSIEFDAAKWREIRAKTGIADQAQVLIDTALELTSTSGQGQLFRKHNDANETLIAIWLAGVQRKAKRIFLERVPKKFSILNAADVRTIAQLSLNEESPLFVGDYLLENFGIILIIDKGISGMKLDGVATRLSSGNPVVALSLRYPRYNNFWFTLIHELAHVTLHYDALAEVIYDDLDEIDSSEVEKEANRFAADCIIPRHLLNKSPAVRSNNEEHIFDLAAQANVHPALVAGAIQHKTRNYKHFAKIVNAIDVRKILGVGE